MNTQRMFALYETMSLPELADHLETLDERRSPGGWTPRDATHRISVTRRIMDLVLGPQALRAAGVECHLECRLVARQQMHAGVLREIAAGGVQVLTDAGLTIGTPVALHIWPSGPGHHDVHVAAIIRAVDRRTVRLSLDEPAGEAEERRLQRVLLAALEHRTRWISS